MIDIAQNTVIDYILCNVRAGSNDKAEEAIISGSSNAYKYHYIVDRCYCVKKPH